MKRVEALSDDDYIKYIEKAKFLHEKGLHTNKSVIQLAQLIYENDQERSGG